MEDDAGLARLVLQKSDAVQVVATECLGMSQELAEELGLAVGICGWRNARRRRSSKPLSFSYCSARGGGGCPHGTLLPVLDDKSNSRLLLFPRCSSFQSPVFFSPGNGGTSDSWAPEQRCSIRTRLVCGRVCVCEDWPG